MSYLRIRTSTKLHTAKTRAQEIKIIWNNGVWKKFNVYYFNDVEVLPLSRPFRAEETLNYLK